MRNTFLHRNYLIRNNKSIFLKGREMSGNPYKFIENCKQHYFDYNPNIKPLLKSLPGSGHHFDHFAIRTVDFPEVNLKRVEESLSEHGYRPSGKHYLFRTLGVEGTHFEPHDSSLPKIFASQLLSKELPKELRKALYDMVSNIPKEVLMSAGLFSYGRPKGWMPNYEQYMKLKQFSEYAAWLYANGYVINHFAISIDSLAHHNITETNHYLKTLGHELNLSQGKEIQGSSAVYLEQSSTKANKSYITFQKNTKEEVDIEVYTTFVEFIKRYPLPNGKLFGDFLPESAQNIFNSTFEEEDDEIPAPSLCAS